MSKQVKAILIIVGGLILLAIGVFASYLLIQRLQVNQLPASASQATVKTSVLVVTRDMFLGDRLAATDLKLVSVPVEIAPRNAITKLEEALNKIIKTDLVQGEMVLSHNLANPTNNIYDLSFILNENQVLMAFPANDLMSKESLIQRGDIVDILATFVENVKVANATTANTAGLLAAPEIKTFTVDVLQKVSVTALVMEVPTDPKNATPLTGGANQSASGAKNKINAYLLALSPQDALILKHLKDTNAIFDIVLRAPTSTGQFNLTPVTSDFIIENYGLQVIP